MLPRYGRKPASCITAGVPTIPTSLRLRRLAKSILRRCSPEEILAADVDWRLICAWHYGDLYILEAIWNLLLSTIAYSIGSSGSRRREQFRLYRSYEHLQP